MVHRWYRSDRGLHHDVTSLAPDGSVVVVRPRTRRRTCPVCGTQNAREILYGLPGFEASNDPSIVLGGCVRYTVDDDFLRWACRDPRCGAWFGTHLRQLRPVDEDGATPDERLPSTAEGGRAE